MSREVRMVPPDWQHPIEWRQDFRTQRPKMRFRPLISGCYEENAAVWDEERAAWERGWIRNFEDSPRWKPKPPAALACDDFEDWSGKRPKPEDYMPAFAPGTATHYMMYETTSDGTPISPAFATPEELAHWLVDNNVSAFGGAGATYEQWLATIRRGWASSAVWSGARIQSGVAALANMEEKKKDLAAESSGAT